MSSIPGTDVPETIQNSSATIPLIGGGPRQAEANLLNLLIVDDERSIRDGCREVAQSLGFTTYVAENAEHAFRVIGTASIDVLLLDMRLPGPGGLEILREVKRRRPETVVVVITGYATVQSAVQAMKHGAYDYVTKPFNLEEIRLLLERVVGHLQLTSENRLLREQIKSKQGFGSIVGRSPEMEKLYRIISKASHSTHPVLILGESGTGKNWSRVPSTSPALFTTSRSFPSIVARWFQRWWKASYSAT